MPDQAFLLRLLLFACCVRSFSAVQRILHGPSNTTVRIGETVVLRCQVADQVGSVQWTKDSFGLGKSREMEPFKRYRMIGSTSDGEYNLEIQNVAVEDDAIYECQIMWGNEKNPSQVSMPVRLSVIAKPQHPILLDTQDTIMANEDSPVRTKCTSINGRPAARLVWVVSLDAQGTRITTYVNNASDVLKEIGIMPIRGQKNYQLHVEETIQETNNGFYTTTSQLDFIPSKEDDGRYLTCVALHPTYEGKYQTTAAGLSVRYKPKVQVQLDESASDLREGGRAVFNCLIDAKPMQGLKVLWPGLEGRAKDTHKQTVIVENLKMEDHLTSVICMARNSIGSTKAVANLTVNFAPRIMSTSQAKLIHAGEVATFHCEAIGNPIPRISWYRVGESNRDEVLGKGSALTIDSVTAHHVGQYECIAHSKGFPPARLSHSLHMKGPPIVQIAEPVYLSTNRVTLSCEVHSKPNPNKIVWYKNGKEIDYSTIDQTRFALKDSTREFGVESRLTIDQVKSSDYGTYNCTAWNEFGSRFSTAEVVKQTFWIKSKKTVMLYVLQVPWYVWLAAFLLSFLLLLICFVRSCCCCCSKRSKSCCSRGDHLKPTKFSDCSDVTVRCEALDNDSQPYFADMFTTSPPLDSSSELLHKDYISIPQNNPDFDFLPPPGYGSYYQQQPYTYNNILECSPNDTNGNHHSSTFNGYNSPIIGQDICVPVYNSHRNNFPIRQLNVAPLEPLAEVDTPTTDNNGLLLENDRAVSRVSTHV